MSRKVKINECGFDALLDLPGVGPKIAGQIIEERDHNRCTCIEDLQSMPRLRITNQLIDMVDFSEEPKMWGYDADALYARSAGFPKTERSLSDWSMGYQEPFRAPSYRFPPQQQRESEFRSFSDREDRMTRPRNERQISPRLSTSYEELYNGRSRSYYQRSQVNSHELKYSVANDTIELQQSEILQEHLPKHLEYNGHGNWQEFFSDFSKYADMSDWSAKQRTVHLGWCVKGIAREFYVATTAYEPDIEYYDLIGKFEIRFGSQGSESQQTLQMEFENAKQRDGESLEKWADRILRIATKAFPSMPVNRMHHRAIIKFCQECTVEEAGQNALSTRPKSMQDAIEQIKLFKYGNRTTHARHEISYTESAQSPVPIWATSRSPQMQFEFNELSRTPAKSQGKRW